MTPEQRLALARLFPVVKVKVSIPLPEKPADIPLGNIKPTNVGKVVPSSSVESQDTAKTLYALLKDRVNTEARGLDESVDLINNYAGLSETATARNVTRIRNNSTVKERIVVKLLRLK